MGTSQREYAKILPQTSWEVSLLQCESVTLCQFRNNISSLSFLGSKTLSLLPADLATLETKQETMFPQQCFLMFPRFFI